MTNIQASEVADVFVGDTGPPLEFVIRLADGVTPMDLTNGAAWVTFWYAGESPHVVRIATITSEAEGAIRYILQGDEYTKVGRIYHQPTVMAPGYEGFVGIGWNTYSGDTIQSRVIARPI